MGSVLGGQAKIQILPLPEGADEYFIEKDVNVEDVTIDDYYVLNHLKQRWMKIVGGSVGMRKKYTLERYVFDEESETIQLSPVFNCVIIHDNSFYTRLSPNDSLADAAQSNQLRWDVQWTLVFRKGGGYEELCRVTVVTRGYTTLTRMDFDEHIITSRPLEVEYSLFGDAIDDPDSFIVSRGRKLRAFTSSMFDGGLTVKGQHRILTKSCAALYAFGPCFPLFLAFMVCEGAHPNRFLPFVESRLHRQVLASVKKAAPSKSSAQFTVTNDRGENIFPELDDQKQVDRHNTTMHAHLTGQSVSASTAANGADDVDQEEYYHDNTRFSYNDDDENDEFAGHPDFLDSAFHQRPPQKPKKHVSFASSSSSAASSSSSSSLFDDSKSSLAFLTGDQNDDDDDFFNPSSSSSSSSLLSSPLTQDNTTATVNNNNNNINNQQATVASTSATTSTALPGLDQLEAVSANQTLPSLDHIEAMQNPKAPSSPSPSPSSSSSSSSSSSPSSSSLSASIPIMPDPVPINPEAKAPPLFVNPDSLQLQFKTGAQPVSSSEINKVLASAITIPAPPEDHEEDGEEEVDDQTDDSTNVNQNQDADEDSWSDDDNDDENFEDAQ